MNVDRTVIEMENFSFAVNGRLILKDITLSVCEGERVSVIGPNGAGKTTLLKCLNRIHTGGTGGIRLAGKPLGAYARRDLARRMSYVPQAGGNIMPFTVSEFVMMGRYPYLNRFSPPDSRDKEAVARALALTGTEEFTLRPLSTLSGGERQRVFIAAALAQEAGILLLDEPAAFLDPWHQTEIHRLLEHINRERTVTMISVTHNINTAALTSDRVLGLKDGGAVFWGAPEEMMNEHVLRDIYGRSFLFASHPRTGKNVVIADVP